MVKTVVFITKSLCYHQVYLADSLYKIYGDNFVFIQTREPLDFRVAAHQEGFERPYLRGLAKSEEDKKASIECLRNADVIIMGEVPHKVISYFNKKALLLRYSERIYKNDLHHYSFLQKVKLWGRYKIEKLFPRCKNQFLLSTGAYTPLDFSKFKLFRNKSFKWGYFPTFEKYDFNDLTKKKDLNSKLNIVWCSRLIRYKHPEVAIDVANFLKSQGIDFEMHIIGDGDEKSGELKELIYKKLRYSHLEKSVIMHGKVPAEEVKKYYEKAHLALFTSSFSEGWGVGVNEAMNAGCVVFCAHSIGCAKYLIEHNENGLIYEFGNNSQLFNLLLEIINEKTVMKEISHNAYKTIMDEWNYEIAAVRLSKLIECLLDGEITPFHSGPCSRATIISEDYDVK